MSLETSKKPIFVSLSPNVEKDDIWLALKLLFQPRKWKRGKAARLLEEKFKKYFGVKYAFSFNSGRSSFLAILNSLGLDQNDEVLLQAFTCNAAVNPIIWSGLNPVFVDIEKETINIDTKDLEEKISKKSKVVLVQHTFGYPANLNRIQEICRQYNLILIEDCAHSLGVKYQGKLIGTFGKAAFFSFGRDKIISSVYGGMVITNDKFLAQKISEFQKQSQYPSYFWIFQQLLHPLLTKVFVIPLYRFNGIGRWVLLVLQKLHILSKSVTKTEKKGKNPGIFPKKLPNALALLALLQFSKLEKFNKQRNKIADFYDKKLKNISGIILPSKKDGRIYLKYSILIPNIDTDSLLKEARKKYIFLNDGWRKSPVVPPDTNQTKMMYRKGQCPMAEKIAKQIINLPTLIKKEDAVRIVYFFKKYLKRKGRLKSP